MCQLYHAMYFTNWYYSRDKQLCRKQLDFMFILLILVNTQFWFFFSKISCDMIFHNELVITKKIKWFESWSPHRLQKVWWPLSCFYHIQLPCHGPLLPAVQKQVPSYTFVTALCRNPKWRLPKHISGRNSCTWNVTYYQYADSRQINAYNIINGILNLIKHISYWIMFKETVYTFDTELRGS